MERIGWIGVGVMGESDAPAFPPRRVPDGPLLSEPDGYRTTCSDRREA